MLRIRLHGRGGQGIKTASQILGTAASLSGFQAQDFPLYGAERRGAPIVAYARMDRQPIRERGSILYPDILLIGDETLLQDPMTAPLAGTNGSTLIFINSTHSARELQSHFSLPALPVQSDLTDLCLQYIQKRSILSTALAAVAARLTGCIPLRHLLRAVRIELEQGHIPAQKIFDNMKLVRRAFCSLPPGQPVERKDPFVKAGSMKVPERQYPVDAAPIILNPGNMGFRKTGNWRTHRPEIDYEICNGCGICYARCPEGDIHLGPDGKPVIDYDHCKGCLICAVECPKHAIHTLREVPSWNGNNPNT